MIRNFPSVDTRLFHRPPSARKRRCIIYGIYLCSVSLSCRGPRFAPCAARLSTVWPPMAPDVSNRGRIWPSKARWPSKTWSKPQDMSVYLCACVGCVCVCVCVPVRPPPCARAATLRAQGSTDRASILEKRKSARRPCFSVIFDPKRPKIYLRAMGLFTFFPKNGTPSVREAYFEI